MPRWSLAIGVVVLLGGVCCGARQLCTPTTCAQGCCDAMGECRLGVLEAACGNGGAVCTVCPTSSRCNAKVCSPGAGGGSGTGGGAAGGIGGGAGGSGGGGAGGTAYPTDGGCWQIATFGEEHSVAGQFNGFYAYKDRGTDPDSEFLLFNTYMGAVPGTEDLSVTTPGVYKFTVTFLDGCTRGTQGSLIQGCAYEYVSVAGSMTVSAATGDINAGSWKGSVTNVHLRQRITDAGSPFTFGPRCIDLVAEAIDVTWP